tara:strand:- start:11342 stop:12394 length:1053 start_codon:yes stop_codon:yes gene_type:complete
MSLYRRKDSPYWWIKLVVDRRTIQTSSGTADRCKAQQLHDRMKAQLWDEVRLGARTRRTWREAVLRYLDESAGNRSIADAKLHLRWIDRHFGELFLEETTRDRIDAARKRRQQDGVAPATVNRLLEIVRTILRRAEREWDWIDKAPHIRLLTVPRSTERHLTVNEAQRLLAELPSHLRAVVTVALETGMRMSEMLQLRWSDVDLDVPRLYVRAEQAKNGFARDVPLSDVAARAIQTQKGLHPAHVFSFEGEPMLRVNGNAWRKALKRAGIPNFRFHDLRHTWATWQARAGTPLLVLQQLGGWRSIQMVQRYAHHQPGHLQSFAQTMSLSSGLGSVLKATNGHKANVRSDG